MRWWVAIVAAAVAFAPSQGRVNTREGLGHPSDAYVIAVGSDPHIDYDHVQTNRNPLDRHFEAAAAMGAHASLILGDVFGARKSDLDGDRSWDCTVDRVWSATCEYPSARLGRMYSSVRAAWSGPSWVIGGNHDGHPPLPVLGGALASPNGWWTTHFAPLDEPGVVRSQSDALAYQLVRIELTSGTWDLLLLHDQTWAQDRAIGGRCDFRDYAGLEALRLGCSTRGWPVGVVTDEQIVWLDSSIAAADAAGRHVLIATHAPAPNTVTLSTPGTAYVQACAGSGSVDPVFVQSPDGSTHFPRDADLLPARTDLDAPIPGDVEERTPLEAAHEHVGSIVRWPLNGVPDDAWGLDLVRRHPAVVRLWVSGHNHLPVPDLVDSVGRGARWDDAVSGTTFLAHGALSWKWMTTSETGRPQNARLELHGDGSWSWQRWSVQTFGTGLSVLGCTTSASLPSTRPAPWAGLSVETGP